MFLRVEGFCCCCTLGTGVAIIAVFELLTGLIFVVPYAVQLNKHPEDTLSSDVWVIMIIFGGECVELEVKVKG